MPITTAKKAKKAPTETAKSEWGSEHGGSDYKRAACKRRPNLFPFKRINAVWIFTRSSFLSIVSSDDPATAIVRARIRQDIHRLWPKAVVTTTPDRDYKYRATIDREAIAEALKAEIVQFTYGNFKASIDDPGRAHWYAWIWRTAAERCPERT